nr:heavy metal-associated isoprenylated plant protein 33-like [Ipomoea batatas]
MAANQALFCENYSFMTCLLWVDTSSSGWQKDVEKVLTNIHGVTSFRMHGGLGMIEVSGTVNPQKLMKKLGKKLAIVWFQFGDSSANLFMPPPAAANPYESGAGVGFSYGSRRFLHFDDNDVAIMNNPFLSTNHRTLHSGRYCSVVGGNNNNAKVTGCRVADRAKTAAAYKPSAPPLPNHGGGDGINGCCFM